MPTFDLEGTKFTFSVLPLDKKADGYRAKTLIEIENEFISYREEGYRFLKEDLERLIFWLYRLLAGAYEKFKSETFDCRFTVELHPYEEGNMQVTREMRRQNDCVTNLQFLLKSSDGKRFLGGVCAFNLHRKETKTLADGLREELEKAYQGREKRWGRYLFIGVSPKGYKGCNYWYLDKTKRTKKGDYVWVKMGRRNIEQIVYVDSVRYCTEETPYPLDKAKIMLRATTAEERAQVEKDWLD
ncbi:MAG: hypothetical protein IJW64_03490 [Clostridia bacterium]|nr:hypothetical protein [Clostridia bacterium]